MFIFLLYTLYRKFEYKENPISLKNDFMAKKIGSQRAKEKKMKKKTLFILTVLALSAMLIGACTPATSSPTAENTAVTNNPSLAEEAEDVAESAVEETEDFVSPTLVSVGSNDDAAFQDQNGNGNFPQGEDCDGTPAYTESDAISQEEAAGLIFMREEEKLARDVYLTLYNEWGLRVFQNIASSEQKHTDSVKGLLDLYGISDPVTDDTIGVFTNPDLQALYDQLVEQGSASLSDALLVGTAIEEIDILDLQEYLAETDDPNISMVYDNLMHGSYNHLRAFVSQYEGQSGQSFSPSYMTIEGYNEAISNATSGGGHGGGGGGGNGGGGHWGN